MKPIQAINPDELAHYKESTDHTVLVLQHGSIGIKVAWEPILVAGAMKFAEALGSKLGERLGDVFMDVLLGKIENDGAFNHEVIERLNRIEGKLDDLINFIKVQFPELFKQWLRDEAIEDDRLELNSKILNLEVVLSHKSNKDQIESAALEVGAAGFKLLQRGQGCYLSGVKAVAALTAAYARIARKLGGKERLKGLGRYGQEYAKLIKPWIDRKNPLSFATLLEKCEAELPVAEALYKTLPANMLVSMIQLSFDPPAQVKSALVGYWAAITPMKDGTLQCHSHVHSGDDIKVEFSDQPPAPYKIDVFAKKVGLQVQSWWQVRILTLTPGADFINQRFVIGEQAIEVAKTAAYIRRNHPAKIEELRLTVECVTKLLEGCEQLATLRGATL